MKKLSENAGICLDDEVIYLNHAAISPWPIVTKQAIDEFSQENVSYGSKNYLKWLNIEQELRENLAALIGVKNPDDIALVKNTSEGLSMVAYGYNWQAGDNVVIPSHEFPSNRIVWQSLESKGVSTVQVDIFPAESPEEMLISACDENTRILSVSSVNYASGLKLDLKKLGEYCREKNILFCIDAIQSVGATLINAEEIHADFIIADGHKWMMGPEGLALFYSHPSTRNKLNIFEYGWHMTENPHDFSSKSFEIATSARRFECGSPNMLCTHALKASTDFILEQDLKKIEKQVFQHTEYLHSLIEDTKNLTCVSETRPGRYAGITTFRHKEIESDRLYEYLMKNNIMCANRLDGVRFSPHFYTPREKIRKAIELADTITGNM